MGLVSEQECFSRSSGNRGTISVKGAGSWAVSRLFWPSCFSRWISVWPPGYEDEWLDRLFGEAQLQILGCWVHGGRYWEVLVNLPELFRSIRRGIGRSMFLRRLSLLLTQTEDALSTEDLPEEMRLTVCAPLVCNEALVLETIFQKVYAPMIMGDRPERKLANATFQGIVHVEELLDWSSFNLDFAIGGVDGCGTSSLHRNLDQHPELTFSTISEDFFFSADLAHRLLPLRSQVESYNQQLKEVKEEKWRSSGFKPTLIGICNPTFFSNALARRKLAAMPSLKMVVILCDPLGRIEKNFMEYYYCFDSLADAKQRGLASRVRDASQPCFESARALLSERFGKLKWFWQQREMAVHMPALMNLFSGRIIILHQEQLRSHPHVVFPSLVNFLEARYSFRSSTVFSRYNSVGGHRTDLCRNASLVSALKLHLEHEYQMQERMMKEATELVPESLQSRQTRCDRMEENSDYCPARTACQELKIGCSGKCLHVVAGCAFQPALVQNYLFGKPVWQYKPVRIATAPNIMNILKLSEHLENLLYTYESGSKLYRGQPAQIIFKRV